MGTYKCLKIFMSIHKNKGFSFLDQTLKLQNYTEVSVYGRLWCLLLIHLAIRKADEETLYDPITIPSRILIKHLT